MLVARPLSSPAKILADCQVSDAVGDLVYITGPMVGGKYVVTRADVTDLTKMPAVGVVIAKVSGTQAVIQRYGDVIGQYTGLVPGKVYWVGTDGRPSVTPPAAGVGQRAYWQAIGVAVDPDVLFLSPAADMKIQNG